MKRCSQCKSLIRDDAARCIRCGWQAPNTASAAPQPEERQQATAVEKRSASSRMRTLAIVLSSPLFFLASCNGIAVIGSQVTTVIQNESRQVPIEDVKGFRHSVAIVATAGDPSSPGRKPVIYWMVKEPKEDLVEFRRRYPGYSFLPPSDKGVVRDPATETNVEYWVLKRESGKALVKTHMNHYVLWGLDVRATYEATDTDFCLISYKAGSDLGLWPMIWGPLPAILLAIFGEILLGRIARFELQSDRRDVGVWAKALAKAKGNVRKAESRYIAMRIKQLKRSGDAKNQSASFPSTAGLASTSQAPVPKVRKRIILGTAAALVVNACAYQIAKPWHATTATEVIRAASVPLIFAVLVWGTISLVRGGKFRASWRVYEGTLLVVVAWQLLGFGINATTH